MTESATITRPSVVQLEMPHPPEKVWDALTQGTLIEEWQMKNDFQAVVGHRVNGAIDCEVLVVEPDERHSYSWFILPGRGAGKRLGEKPR